MELRLLCLISYHSAFTDQQGLWVIRDKTWIVPHLSCAAGRSQTWRLAFGICGVVVQLVRTPACQAGGRRFEPGRPRHISKDLRLLTSRIELDCDANCDITPSKVPPNSPWLACSRRLCLAERLMVFCRRFQPLKGLSFRLEPYVGVKVEHPPADMTGDAHDGLVALAAFAKL